MKTDFEARRRANDPVAALPFDIGNQLAAALRDACDLQVPGIFIDLVTWAQTALVFRDLPPSAMVRAIDAMSANATAYVPAADGDAARRILSKAREEVEIVRLIEEPAIDESSEHGAAARRFLDAVLDGNEARAAQEALLCVASGARIVEVYENVLTPVLHEAGRLWQRNEISVSQEHIVTAATERVMAQLLDLASPRPHRELSVVVCAPGNAQHQVGARMVTDAFALCGWNATFAGGNLPIDDCLQYLDTVSVDVLALSATIGSDIAPIRALIAELEAQPISPLVLVGGRAFGLHPSLWRQVGADGFAPSPLGAVALAGRLVCPCEAE